MITPRDPAWEEMHSAAEPRQKHVSKERPHKWPFSNFQTHGKMSSDLNKKYVSIKKISHSGALSFALLPHRPCCLCPLFQGSEVAGPLWVSSPSEGVYLGTELVGGSRGHGLC